MRGRETSKFHVAVLQRQLRTNVKKKKNVKHARSCCFANLNLLSQLFRRSLASVKLPWVPEDIFFLSILIVRGGAASTRRQEPREKIPSREPYQTY